MLSGTVSIKVTNILLPPHTEMCRCHRTSSKLLKLFGFIAVEIMILHWTTSGLTTYMCEISSAKPTGTPKTLALQTLEAPALWQILSDAQGVCV